MNYLKFLIIPFALLILSTSIFAQNYIPFPTENTYWTAYERVHENYHRNYEIETGGKFLKNGLTFIKLILREERQKLDGSGSAGPWVFKKYTFGYFRNDSINKKVYFTYNLNTQESLWYDFNLQAGDTLFTPYDSSDVFGVPTVVKSVDSILINGSYRTRLTMEGSQIRHIEGVGSTAGLGGYGLGLFENEEILYCQSVDGLVEYSDGSCGRITSVAYVDFNLNEIIVYLNPVNGQTLFRSTNLELIESVKVFDNLGMVVFEVTDINSIQLSLNTSSFNAGIYHYQAQFKGSNQSMVGRLIKN